MAEHWANQPRDGVRIDLAAQLLFSRPNPARMESKEKLELIMEVKKNIIDYLQEEITINSAALKSYEDRDNPIQNADSEIKRMREFEAMKLRDRIHELARHIAVIKRM